MRDMIIDEWKRVGDDKIDVSRAYTYAELIVRNVENFPDIDPLLVLSMACVESAFGEKAVSFRGAAGILQVMPYTARPYFELFGIPYSDSALYLPANNIRVGIRYFADILASHYKLEKALAIYNCGYAGEYYLDSMVYIPQETREYVPKVLCKWVEYKRLFEEFNVNSLLVKADTIRLDSIRIKNTDLKAKKKPRKKGRYAYKVEEEQN
jgi:soluble lytic murein transglycosylase-like protein